MSELQVKLLTETAKLPTRGTEFAAGLDLHADSFQIKYKDGTLGSVKLALDVDMVSIGDLLIVNTGIAVAIPNGMVGIVHGRSGWAFNNRIICANYGLIDSDYRGEIKQLFQILPRVAPAKTLVIKQGDRVGQLLLQKYEDFTLIVTNELPATERGEKGIGSTDRGEGGFGSTGI
jgi:dUTP pyrophosphatase